MAASAEEGRRQQPPQAQEEKRSKKLKKAFIYGNYKTYYGYRINCSVKEDPRLATFKREWFEDKDCLDIGCNEGLITISIAKKFFCRSILGIDIDAGLVETAYWNLRKMAKKECGNCRSMEASLPVEELFKRVSFLHENFVKNLHGCSEKYDTVLCLSVTKWVHLNWGDDGLINMFVKIWRILRPGGILLLESQPWSSYKRNYRVSETTKSNFHSICLKPDKFREILLDKIGFRSAELVTDDLSRAVAGFDRPIVMFCK